MKGLLALLPVIVVEITTTIGVLVGTIFHEIVKVLQLVICHGAQPLFHSPCLPKWSISLNWRYSYKMVQHSIKRA